MLSNDLTAFKPKLFCSLEQTSLVHCFLKENLLVYKTVFGLQEVKNAVKIIDFNLRNKLIHLILVR